MTEKKEYGSQPVLGNWKKSDIPNMYEALEEPNWAPWLAASMKSLEGRIDTFEKGQLVIKNEQGEFFVSLSMNRINWDGNPETLPSWDEVAGDPTTYEHTYIPSGNTLTLMSMNVNPKYQGEGYARQMIAAAKQVGKELDVDYIIGSFRPNEYGKHKLTYGPNAATFTEYCKMVREDGLPVDSWLRNLTRNGMIPLKVDHKAMEVTANLPLFAHYFMNYYQGQWQEVAPFIWECGEVGNWTLDLKRGGAIYTESNLWGVLWTKAGSQ